MARFCVMVSLAFVFLFTLPLAQSQGGIGNTTSTPVAGVPHDYITGLNEIVNPANGALSVRIGQPVPRERGQNWPGYALVYDSNSFFSIQPTWFASQVNNGVFTALTHLNYTYVAPQSYNYQTLTTQIQTGQNTFTQYTCTVYSGYVFTDPSGGKHALGLAVGIPGQGGPNACNEFGLGGNYLQGGDEQYKATVSSAGGGATVVDSHGNNPGVEDSNGNYRNSTGRTQSVPALYSVQNQTVGFSGAINATPQNDSAFVCQFTNIQPIPPTTPGPQAFQAPQSVTLSNGQQYLFSYHPTFGMISKITYPTGATVSYTWSTIPNAEGVRYQAPVQTGAGGTCALRHDWFAITKRVVSVDGVNPVEEQDFSYVTNWSGAGYQWTSKTTTVTTKDLLRGTSFNTVYTYSPILPPPESFASWEDLGYMPQENTISYYDTNGSLLKTITKKWTTTNLLSAECETLPTAQTSGKFYQYQPYPSFAGGSSLALNPGARMTDLPTDVAEYDYGAVSSSCVPTGSPIRETKTTYQAFGNTPLFPGFPSILDRPASVQVYSGSTLMEETDYAYDAATPTAPSVTPSGHDEAHYGYGLSAPRGNPTTVTKKCLVSGGPACVNSVTTFTYDTTGQVLSSKDTNLNTTLYDYTDNYSSDDGTGPGTTNAYVTKITRPSTGGVSHITRFQYGYLDGKLRKKFDEDSQPTTFCYWTNGCSGVSFDPFFRLTGTSSPDTGGSTVYYYDSGPSPSVQTSTQITPSIAKVDTAVLDAMGRVVQTQLNSDPDPDGVTFSDTTYDGLGLVWKRSNPYRSGGSVDNTTSTYDALGRTVSVGEPDGSIVSTVYSGNTATVTDEALNKRKTQTDALGRLAYVWEDPATLSYETDYFYDALDNLTGVTQKGGSTSGNWRNRSFAYNSLSQLVCAANPEVAIATCPNPDTGAYTAGTIRYSYDGVGNLLSKTAPKPNQSSISTTVVTSYAYDMLNRLTSKSYNDGLTATVKFGYDHIAPPSCTISPPSLTDNNSTGNRTAMCDGSGATSWSHDPMGRVAAETRTIKGATNLTKSIAYGYNLDGSLATLTYPSGRIVAYDVRGAGRPISAIENANSITYVTGAAYTPWGALSALQLGGTSGRWSYNNRLQPLQIYATNGTAADSGQLQQTTCPTTAATLMSRIYNFNPGHDNGNVTSFADCLVAARGQNFDYDHLNRLVDGYSAGNTGSSIPGNWGEDYTIDPWGNLTNIATHSGRGHSETLNCAAASVGNRLTTCFQYDAAGNLNLNGTTSYTYDAENRLTATSGNSYVYDGGGKRVINCVGAYPSCTTATLYRTGTGSDTLSETSWTGAQVQEYTFFNGRRIARRYSSANTVKYMFADHLGSNDLLLDSTGVIERASFYYPFGGEVLVSGSGTNSYKFTGKERDAESGLDNFDFRYYGSSLGRFMKPDDPLLWWDRSDPQSLNLYSYAENNPVSSTDDGHSVTICDTNGHCNTVSDDDYSAAQQADKNNVAPSLSNLANSSTGTGAITNSAGGVVGTVQWTPDNPGIQTLGLAGQMAAPGVNFAAQGLRMFGYAFAAPVMVAAECLAGAPSCTKGNVAMAILPEVGALREGTLLLKEGAAFGKGAEILQKAGGVEQAAKDFESVQGTESVYGSARVKTLSDGSKVLLYQSTGGSGATTIAIQNAAGRTVTKIRY